MVNEFQHNILIANRIQQLINDKNISINRLATLANLTQGTVNSIYTGQSKNPTIKTIKRICDALDISVNEFFNYEPYNIKPSEDEKTMGRLMDDVQTLSKQLELLQKQIDDKTKKDQQNS